MATHRSTADLASQAPPPGSCIKPATDHFTFPDLAMIQSFRSHIRITILYTMAMGILGLAPPRQLPRSPPAATNTRPAASVSVYSTQPPVRFNPPATFLVAVRSRSPAP